MKVSGFTFVRNGVRFGYPFVQSIRSILPIVDEFIAALGPSDDGTDEALQAIGDPRIRIIRTQWNDNLRPNASVKGFVTVSRNPPRYSVAPAIGPFIWKEMRSSMSAICPESERRWSAM